MIEIRNWYEGINFVTIPKVIIDELKTFSDNKSSISKRNKEGIMETTYTGYNMPVFIRFSKHNFWVNPIFYESLREKLRCGICFDIHKNKIDCKNMDLFYSEYGKGFYKGYNEFENSLKKNTSIFGISNEQISYKIYARIKEHWTTQINGEFIIETETSEKNEMIFIFRESNFFESGFNGGEFYKAWEIILNNPTLFEPIFIAYSETKEKQIQTEAIDLSDTTATEKIIYLQKLGVIDFLRTQQPFSTSVNSLATILSGLTGVKSGTIQPMLNAMLSKDIDTKNNPLNSKKTVERVEQQLLKIGFKLK